MKETDLAAKVIEHFKGLGYEAYQEVKTPSGRFCDLIFKKGDVTAAVETKLSFNMTLLSQADDNAPYVSASYVCFPDRLKVVTTSFAVKVCRSMGIGVLLYSRKSGEISLRATPSILVPKSPIKLLDGMKDFSKAGSNFGKKYTPFRETCILISRYLEVNGESEIRVVMSNVKHHYSSLGSAVSTIRKRVRMGAVEGVELDKSKNRIKIKEIKWK